MATGGGLVSTHIPKKLRVENWLHKCQLLPLGSGTVVGTSQCNKVIDIGCPLESGLSQLM